MDLQVAINVFIDTEFTDFAEPQLISIGMASETGEEFYAEIPYELRHCSEFVKETVLPMLGYASEAEMTKDGLREKIARWLCIIRPGHGVLRICYDYQTDWDLFVEAMGGQIPTWCTGRLVADRINEVLRREYHQQNSLPEHHALNDARANRYAFQKSLI